MLSSHDVLKIPFSLRFSLAVRELKLNSLQLFVVKKKKIYLMSFFGHAHILVLFGTFVRVSGEYEAPGGGGAGRDGRKDSDR